MPKLPEMIDLDLNLPRPPFWLISTLMTLLVLSWLPLVLIARARVTLSEKPAIHIFQDMDNQPKKKTQASSILFADGRAMRPPVPGTVARGQLREDDHYYRGYSLVQNDDGGFVPEYFQGFPPEIEINKQLLLRGQERYDIFCFPCHGKDGQGNGPITVRANQLMKAAPGSGTAWTPPSNLAAIDPNAGKPQYGPELYPEGKMFNTISNGIRNMPGYRTQIDVEDRWAIIAYIYALQLSQNAPADVLTAEERGQLQ